MEAAFPVAASNSADGFQGLLFLVVFMLMGISMYFAVARIRRRRRQLSAIAREMGWTLEAGNRYPEGDEFGEFEIFRQGHSQYSYNTMCGSIRVGNSEWPAIMGDYHYKVTGSCGKGSTTLTHCFSYLLVQMPFRGVPNLIVRREGLTDVVKNAFGFEDIDFESAEFSRQYCVKSSDRRFSYDVIHPAMMEYLLNDRPASIEIGGSHSCLGDGRSVWSPEEFRVNAKWARGFFELWPAHLTNQLNLQP